MDKQKYLRDMKAVFTLHYIDDQDVWSQDQGLRRSASVLQASLARPSLILDIGCGRGVDSESLLDYGHTVHGLDLYPHPQWSEIQKRFPATAQFFAGDYQSYSALAAYDAILDNGCFHHQAPETQSAYLNKAYEMLKADGWFCLNVYTPKTETSVGMVEVMKDGRFARVFDAQQLEETLRATGFEPKYMSRVPSSTHSGSYLIALSRRTK